MAEKAAAIDGATQLIGLLGYPVSHSFSPAMHNAAARAADINWAYVPMLVHPSRLEAAIRGLPALSIRGVNVTTPHKQAVIPLLDELHPAAAAIGAVNTIVVGEKLVGYNTDYSGFVEDLRSHGADIAGNCFWLLGAGGSARAVAYGLLDGGAASVTIFARRREQAEALATTLPSKGRLNIGKWGDFAGNSPATLPILINSTPVGMSPELNQSPLGEEKLFPPCQFVYDLVYNPRRTKLMGQAENAGIPAANGLGMLLRQGAQAFELWTGIPPDLAAMRQALDE